jgi:hypothetical protein
MRQIIVLLLAAALVGAIALAPASAESAAQDVAYGTGSVFTTLVYAPVKATFCILGGITSGFTLPFAGPQTAEKVATRACGGTWVITPDALKGKEPVRFVGGDGSSPREAAKR